MSMKSVYGTRIAGRNAKTETPNKRSIILYSIMRRSIISIQATSTLYGDSIRRSIGRVGRYTQANIIARPSYSSALVLDSGSQRSLFVGPYLHSEIHGLGNTVPVDRRRVGWSRGNELACPPGR